MKLTVHYIKEQNIYYYKFTFGEKSNAPSISSPQSGGNSRKDEASRQFATGMALCFKTVFGL